MRLSRSFATNFQFIEFDGDEGGYEGIGFPMFTKNFLPYQPQEEDPASYSKFRSLSLYNTVCPYSMHDAGLESFSWRNERNCSDSILTLEFELARSSDKVVLIYGAARMIADTGLSTGFQSLFVEALGRKNSGYRHEFLFHNAVLIIESQSFDFNIESAEFQK